MKTVGCKLKCKEAFSILNQMMDSFEKWFPIDEADTKEDIEIDKESFAAAKLCLELGEYTRYDYDYLFWLRGIVADDEYYATAIDVFIEALSNEYGWI